MAQRLVDLAATLLVTHPSAVPDLVQAAGFALEGVEVVIPGASNELSEHLRLSPMVRTVLVTGDGPTPLLRDRRVGLAYVCRAGVCQLPVESVSQLDEELRRART